MTPQQIHELGLTLFEAFESGNPVAPLTDAEPALGIGEAYAVQAELIRLHEAAGRRRVARKVGLTSKAIQQQLGVSQPDSGVVFDAYVFDSGATMSRSALRMIAPRLEAELAFVLERDLRGPGVTIPDVLAATAGVIAVYEVLDSRIANWRITISDTIADNASGFGTILGETLAPVRGLDLTTVGLVLERDGEQLATSAGAAVFGHPARSVAWLADTLAANGEGLSAGEIVLTGSFTAAIDVVPGRYRARFGGGIGSVEVVIEA